MSAFYSRGGSGAYTLGGGEGGGRNCAILQYTCTCIYEYCVVIRGIQDCSV